jgi:hypothetical protein
LAKGANPRFIVTSLSAESWPGRRCVRAAVLRSRRDG